jgi:cytochrome c oxidase subunit 2
MNPADAMARIPDLLPVAFTALPFPSASAESPAGPLNYFLHSYGPASTPIMHLGWVITALMIVILLIITLLLLGALYRKRPAAESTAVIAPDKTDLLWITVGTGISSGILFVLLIYVLMTLNSVAKPGRAPALALTVTGYDWWWKVEYEDKDPDRRIVTANEIHIPVGRPVLIRLKSADVIHAFWVPVLAGKTQMIPGLANQQWLEADVPGVYRGQCTQYCGAQHAHMDFEIVAQSPSDFRKWLENQWQTAVPVTGSTAEAGQKLFGENCAGCHAIRGTLASGMHGPDLTHLNSRRLIAAGLLSNTPENRMKWISHVQALKPGARMPSFAFSDEEAAELSAFLSTLD